MQVLHLVVLWRSRGTLTPQFIEGKSRNASPPITLWRQGKSAAQIDAKAERTPWTAEQMQIVGALLTHTGMLLRIICRRQMRLLSYPEMMTPVLARAHPMQPCSNRAFWPAGNQLLIKPMWCCQEGRAMIMQASHPSQRS